MIIHIELSDHLMDPCVQFKLFELSDWLLDDRGVLIITPETVRYAREDFLYLNKVDEYEDALDVALNEISLRTADTPYDDRLSAKIARKLDGKGFSRTDIFRVLDELRRRYE